MKHNRLVFVTQNPHKLEEVQHIFKKNTLSNISLEGLQKLGFIGDIPENEKTLKGNAWAKAAFIHNRYGCNCFADDTGLEVDALDGRPGVYSSRYAGIEGDAGKNVEKLLGELQGINSRTARFRTFICLILNDTIRYFEGRVEGKILEAPEGTMGFGYDPVFLPDGYDQSFAVMEPELKNRISHRYDAINKLIRFLSGPEGKSLLKQHGDH